MAECGSWQSIQKYGLLSTTTLLNLFEVPEPQRSKIESEQRTDGVPIYDIKLCLPSSTQRTGLCIALVRPQCLSGQMQINLSRGNAGVA